MKRALIPLALFATPAAAQEVNGPPDLAEYPEATTDAGSYRLPEAVERYEDKHNRKIGDDWELAFQLLNATDAIQTIAWCESRVGKCEINPLYGDHPSAGKIAGIKAGTGIIHYLIYRTIRAKNPEAAKRCVDAFYGLMVLGQGSLPAVVLAAKHRIAAEAPLRAEIERLREVLEWYGRVHNWRSSTMYMCGHAGASNAEIDRGNKARQALTERK